MFGVGRSFVPRKNLKTKQEMHSKFAQRVHVHVQKKILFSKTFSDTERGGVTINDMKSLPTA